MRTNLKGASNDENGEVSERDKSDLPTEKEPDEEGSDNENECLQHGRQPTTCHVLQCWHISRQPACQGTWLIFRLVEPSNLLQREEREGGRNMETWTKTVKPCDHCAFNCHHGLFTHSNSASFRSYCGLNEGQL